MLKFISSVWYDGYLQLWFISKTYYMHAILKYWSCEIFSHLQVNSDVVYSKRNKYGDMDVIFVDKTYVGKLIVTKMIGSNNYNNITDSYKHAKSKLLCPFTLVIITILTSFLRGNAQSYSQVSHSTVS